ncbi:hypothetical protein Nepgr_003924 [Nepenthes gracilis]|uniref:Uncharacterized protein n=1 Tax=Nepenthes gracilis TaxID=150966 RepID=A0AAD3XEJ9_NEPGR|nr:hypothetical protein Nepgr_003924 [Nepenthes gracilis]
MECARYATVAAQFQLGMWVPLQQLPGCSLTGLHHGGCVLFARAHVGLLPRKREDLQITRMLLDRFGMWVNGVTEHSGMTQVDFKLMEWPAFGSNFPIKGLTDFGGMWSSW